MQAVPAPDQVCEPEFPGRVGRHRTIQCLAVQLVLLVGMGALAPLLPLLPRELEGLHRYGPVVALVVAGTLAAAFNRGRVALAIGVLAAGYGMFAGRGGDLAPAALAVSVFVPFSLAGLSLVAERGVFTRHAVRRLFALALGVGLSAWWTADGTWQFIAGAMPAVSVVGIGLPVVQAIAAMAAIGATAHALSVTRTAIDAAFVSATIAVCAGGLLTGVPHAFGFLVSVGAICLTVGVLQDAYRLAFVDELTGLGGRRALNEKLLTLGERFAIAMVDVDHFKRVNDSHGHDVGDHVLRMVSAHLARTGGGGRAYRYGGEEFALVFPGKSAREVIVHLERLRASIEDYRLQLRAADGDDGDARSGATGGRQARRPGALRVTVSIGVAERDPRHLLPESVLQAADQALYRAKGRGRNRLSR